MSAVASLEYALLLTFTSAILNVAPPIVYETCIESASGSFAVPDASDSIQASYTMGGATLSIAEVDVENQSYSTAATADLDATIISLGLAF